MRLSWNEVRVRAASFAEEWRDAAYEKGETQSFYNDFFEVFDVRRRSVARYEEHVAKLGNGRGFIDLYWPGVLIVEQKSARRDLDKAYGQAGEYFDALPERDRLSSDNQGENEGSRRYECEDDGRCGGAGQVGAGERGERDGGHASACSADSGVFHRPGAASVASRDGAVEGADSPRDRGR